MSKNKIIGLDIGSYSVKAVEASYEGGVPHIGKSVCVPIELDKKDKKNIINATRKALEGFDVRHARVASVVNSPKTGLASFSIPSMPKNEIAEAVRWELKNRLPFPVDGFVIDYEAESNSEGGYDVTVAFSPSDLIDAHLYVLREAGIIAPHLITSGFALKKFAEHAHPGAKIICAVDLGDSQSEIYIFSTPRSGQVSRILFSRKLPVAGFDITKAMAGVTISDKGRVELSADEAERIKKENGVLQPLHILSMMRPQIERLAGEISRSLDYYKTSKDAAVVDKIILFGGTARLKGIKEFFEESIGIEVVLDETGLSLELASAAGAAIGRLKGPNLIPSQVKEHTVHLRNKLYMEAGVTAVVTIAALFFVGMQIQIASLNSSIHTAKLELSAIAPVAGAQPQETDELKGRLAIVAQSLKKTVAWDEALKELSNIARQNMELTYLRGEGRTLTLKGVLLEEESKAIEEVSAFISTMQEGLFKDVTLASQKKSLATSGAYEFEIRCEVK